MKRTKTDDELGLADGRAARMQTEAYSEGWDLIDRLQVEEDDLKHLP